MSPKINKNFLLFYKVFYAVYLHIKKTNKKIKFQLSF